jgi:hypothetical protein
MYHLSVAAASSSLLQGEAFYRGWEEVAIVCDCEVLQRTILVTHINDGRDHESVGPSADRGSAAVLVLWWQ